MGYHCVRRPRPPTGIRTVESSEPDLRTPIAQRLLATALPASEMDQEMARRMFDGEGGVTEYIARIGISVENTTGARADAIHMGVPDRGTASGAGAESDRGLQEEGTERRADRHKARPWAAARVVFVYSARPPAGGGGAGWLSGRDEGEGAPPGAGGIAGRDYKMVWSGCRARRRLGPHATRRPARDPRGTWHAARGGPGSTNAPAPPASKAAPPRTRAPCRRRVLCQKHVARSGGGRHGVARQPRLKE